MLAEYDIAIIGAGPGGIAAMKAAKQFGKKAVVVEDSNFGGICLNNGCMPTKHMVANGISGEKLAARRKMVDDLKRYIKQTLLPKCGDVIEGKAVFEDGQTISVGGKKIRFEACILAVGSAPNIPQGLNKIKPIAPEDAVWLAQDDIKGRPVYVVGAGVIGVEFAYLFSSAANKVVLIDKEERILPNVDPDISKAVLDDMRSKGIEALLNCQFDEDAIEKDALVIFAIGRRGHSTLQKMNEKIGLELDERGFAKTDEFHKTNVENIYAIGDCAGKRLYAYTASFEGMRAVEYIATGSMKEYPVVPSIVFSTPPVLEAGWPNLGEAQTEQVEYKTVRYPFAEMQYIYPHKGILKIGIEKRTGAITYAGLFGPDATGIAPFLTMAIQKKMTIDELKGILYVHPTLAEVFAHM